MTQISKKAVICKNVSFHGNVRVLAESYIGDNCVIGQPWNDDKIERIIKQKSEILKENSVTVIEHDVWLLPNCIVCNGARIKKGSWCDAGSFIGERAIIGRDTWIHYGSRVNSDVVIGNQCNIGGFLCNRVVIGDNVTSFGNLIHRLDQGYGRTKDRATDEDPSPILRNNVYVGWNSLVIGGITLGEGAFIGANSIITKDIPAGKKIGAGARV